MVREALKREKKRERERLKAMEAEGKTKRESLRETE